MVNYRRFMSPSFRSKIFLASFLCVGLPVLICLSVYSYLTRDAVEEQAITNAQKELSLVEENVSNLFDDMINVTNFVQFDTELNTILKQKSKEPPNNSPQDYESYMEDKSIRKTIENITLLGEKSFVTILLQNGAYYTNYAIYDYHPQNYFQTEWMEQLQSLSGYRSLWVGAEPTVFAYDRVDHPYQVSMARTLRDVNQEIYGYVIVTILETKIRNVLDNQAKNETIMLIDETNDIISSSNEAMINKSLPFGQQLEAKNMSQTIQWNEEEQLVTMTQFPVNNWKLVSIIPYKEATQNINSIFSNVFFLLFLSFVLFFIILVVLMNRITYPLKELNTSVQKVQQGDLSFRVDVKSRDEVGQLASSFNQMIIRLNEMFEEVKQTEIRKRHAELAMLQSQINPHFLFNVLNSIRLTSMKANDMESAQMLMSLSKLLRATIGSTNEMILLKEEIELIQDYITLMNKRQRNKIVWITDIEKEAETIFVPRFIFQPIIENAIIHGLQQGEGVISMEATMNGESMQVMISDNGRGMNRETSTKLTESIEENIFTEKSHHSFSSIGLANVYERLRLSYKADTKISIESEENMGTRVVIQIPARRDNGV